MPRGGVAADLEVQVEAAACLAWEEGAARWAVVPCTQEPVSKQCRRLCHCPVSFANTLIIAHSASPTLALISPKRSTGTPRSTWKKVRLPSTSSFVTH